MSWPITSTLCPVHSTTHRAKSSEHIFGKKQKKNCPRELCNHESITPFSTRMLCNILNVDWTKYTRSLNLGVPIPRLRNFNSIKESRPEIKECYIDSIVKINLLITHCAVSRMLSISLHNTKVNTQVLCSN